MKGLNRKICLLTLWFTILAIPAALLGDAEQILFRLAQRCKESGSDSVLILRNGKPLFEYRSSLYWEPMETMSITKSISALAIGLLLYDGAIDSVDTPVYTFFPEWNQGLKKTITVRHLLANTSGLQAEGNTDEIYYADNIVRFALCAELTYVPGTYYYYNNKAINLISGIVKSVTGKSLSEFLTLRLFGPLGLQNVSWLCDGANNDYAMAHLIINAPDLCKIGGMLAQGGTWCGKRYLDPSFIDLLCKPVSSFDPYCGHLWWTDYYNVEAYWDDELLDQYVEADINPDYISNLRRLQGRIVNLNGRTTTPSGCNFFNTQMIELLGGMEAADKFFIHIKERGVPFARWRVGALKSFSARGSGGQQLIVIPDKKVVAVRLSHVRKGCWDPFHDFGALVDELAYRMGS